MSEDLETMTALWEKCINLVHMAKAKFLGSRLVLSGALRSKGVTWRRVGAANDRLDG